MSGSSPPPLAGGSQPDLLLKGVVNKSFCGQFHVGTGLVLQDESFRMNPCPNPNEDSHPPPKAGRDPYDFSDII